MFRPQTKTPYRVQVTCGETDFGATSDLWMYDPVKKVDRKHGTLQPTDEEVRKYNS